MDSPQLTAISKINTDDAIISQLSRTRQMIISLNDELRIAYQLCQGRDDNIRICINSLSGDLVAFDEHLNACSQLYRLGRKANKK